jgi:LmbE family N-acetylglucosaminyl deacetylase
VSPALPLMRPESTLSNHRCGRSMPPRLDVAFAALAVAVRSQRLSRDFPDLNGGHVTPLGCRLLVVSPHCDDAILSLGATLSYHVRRGGSATVITALAGDSTSRAPAGAWDLDAGFHTAGQAAMARQEEDLAACSALGVEAVHVHEPDGQYVRHRDDRHLWATVRDAAPAYDDVLLPGYPLWHPDHRRVTEVVLNRLQSGGRLRLYVEEPYASWLLRRLPTVPTVEHRSLVSGVLWGTAPVRSTDRRRKIRAASCYRSQLPLLAGSPAENGRLSSAARMLATLWHSAWQRGELFSAPLPGRLPLGRHAEG